MVDNPCRDQPERDDRNEEERNPCRPGYVRNEQGRCVPESRVESAITEIPPLPENPFAIDAILSVNIEDPVEEESEELNADPEAPTDANQAQQQIQYISATRDLTTIDEGLYYSIVDDESLRTYLDFFGFSGARLWLGQKEEAENTSLDNFRIAMGNFWVFDGESESMFSPIVTNPRLPGGPNPDLNNNQFTRHRTLQFYKQAPENANNNYRYIRDDNFFTPDKRYSCLEILPFRFDKDLLEQEARQLNLDRDDTPQIFTNFTYASIQDTYLDGLDSPVFSNIGQNFPRIPERRMGYTLANIEYNRSFFDFVFDAPAAFLESEANKLVVTPSDIANIQVMVQNQEIFQDVESELNLPNIYSFYQSRQLEKTINNDESILETLPAGQVEFAQRTIANFNELSDTNPFQDSRVHKFPSDKVEQLQEINEAMRASVTNFVEINIKTRQGQPINSLIQENKMDVPLLQILGYMANGVRPDGRKRSQDDYLYRPTLFNRQVRRVFTKILDDEFISADSQESVAATVNDKAISGIGEGVLVYLNEILEDLVHIRNRNLFWPRNIDSYPLYYNGWDREDLLKLEETITSQIFLRKMEQHIIQNKLFRRYTDIIHGSKAYAEVIGYKIEKYKIVKNETGEEQEEKVQTFLLMDNDRVRDIEFLDAQVIPDRKYKYKIFTINFVIGSRYKYVSNELNRYTWKNRIENQLVDRSRIPGSFTLPAASGFIPSIIYAPYFEKTVSLADKPPIFPQVDFLPYQGVDNTHALLLQANYGEMTVPPIKIFTEDQAVINNMYQRQAIPPGGNILYKSDSLPNGFEIIRIDQEPESYSDFSNPDAIVTRIGATGKTAYINLSVEPNKTYYYCFRTYDDGGISNPTEVFKVRMVSYQNGIFMEVEAFEMKKKQEDYKLTFEKLLQISPSLSQRVINFSKRLKEIDEREQEGEISELKRLRKELGIRNSSTEKEFQRSAPPEEMLSIGMEEGKDSIWDKRFKIRCVSKTTGKKIDLNISFIQGKIVMDTPIESVTKEFESELRQETKASPITVATPRGPTRQGPSGGGSSY